MKKNTKYLIASLACVAVLGAAALALVLTGGSEGEDTASSASDETITLLDKTQQDLESVTVTNEEGTITVLAHEETVESSSDAASSDASDASGTESESEPETEIVYEVEELEGLPAIQLEILSALSGCVRPGGRLLYSTCTLRERENGGVTRAFLEQAGEFTLRAERTLWPDVDGTDGFYICLMEKSQ